MRKIIAIAAVLIFSAALYAQDRIYTANGECLESKVQSMNKDVVKISPIDFGTHTVKQLPRKYVSKIVFADGMEVNFTGEGELIRDGLLDSPYFKAKGSRVYAEGVIPLTEEETAVYYEPERYYLSFKPERTRYLTGMAQMFAGGAGFGLCAFLETPISFGLNKDIWIRNYENSFVFHGLTFQRTTPLNVKGREIFAGHLVPVMVTAEFFTATTLVSGVTNIITSSAALKKINARANKPAPSLAATKAQYWTGIGLTAVGTGALIGGFLDLNAHKDWYIEHNPDPRYERHEGDAPVAGPILALAGSILMNIGITEFTVANSRMRGYNRVAGSAPLALTCGPTASGYGMTVRF